MSRPGIAVLLAATILPAGLGRSVAGQNPRQDVPVFSGGINNVRIDARVTENERVVRGLAAADFEVRDNGVVQDVEIAIVEQLPVNLVMAFDASESVAGTRIGHLQNAASALLDGLKQHDRVALLTFNQAVASRQTLSNEYAPLRRELTMLKPAGLTSLVDATYSALTLTQPGGSTRNLALIFSDGDDTASWLTTDRVLEVARRADATVYGVSLRGTGRDGFLRRVSAVTGGSLLEVDSMDDLARAFTQVLAEFRDRYVLSYTPKGVSTVGWHSLQVRVRNRRAAIATRAGYFAQ